MQAQSLSWNFTFQQGKKKKEDMQVYCIPVHISFSFSKFQFYLTTDFKVEIPVLKLEIFFVIISFCQSLLLA